ncbi:MAG: hypothetical protein AAF823_07100 [Planctomycetota bacterium]
MDAQTTPSPLMRVLRTPLGRYQLQVGLARLDLGPGDLKKLNHLLHTAVHDYADNIAQDACGPDLSDRQLPPNPSDDPDA